MLLTMTTTCTSALSSTYGFHTSLITNVSTSPPIPSCSNSSSCTFFLKYTISHSIFVDPHELPHHHQPVQAFNFTHHDAFDLEKPEHAILSGEVPGFVVEVGRATLCDKVVEFSVDVPIHARYPDPRRSARGGVDDVFVEPPKGFWVCGGTGESLYSLSSLYFSDDTIHLVVSPSVSCSPSSPNATTIRIPLADTRQLPIVEFLTALAVLLGAVYVLNVAWKTSIRLEERGSANQKTD